VKKLIGKIGGCLALCLFLSACTSTPEPEYTQIRAGSKGPGPVSNEPLYKKMGDPTGIYIKSLDGQSYIRLSR
jgi:hypothetical protein